MEVSRASQDTGNDEAITPQQLIAELMNAIHKAGSQNKFATTHHVSQSLVSLTVTGKRGIDASVANALGYIKRVRVEYVPLQRGRSPLAPSRVPGDATQKPDIDDKQPDPATRRSPGDDLTTGGELPHATKPEYSSSDGWQRASTSSAGCRSQCGLDQGLKGAGDAVGERERQALAE